MTVASISGTLASVALPIITIAILASILGLILRPRRR